MRLKLKEEPREWQKFVSVLLALPLILTGLAWRRGVLAPPTALLVGVSAAVLAALCWIWPRPFRPVYRVGMTIGFHMGQAMGMLMLTVLFFVLVTPMGWIMRLKGKDPLRLKRSVTHSYWQARDAPGRFDRQF